jgi:hypothetical protein
MPEVRQGVLLVRREGEMRRKSRRRIVKEMLLWRRIVTTNNKSHCAFAEHLALRARKYEHFKALLELSSIERCWENYWTLGYLQVYL